MDGDNEGDAKIMEDAEIKHRVQHSLSRAMQGARAYGSAVVIMMTKEAPMDTELNIDAIRPGDLTTLRVFDRYDLSVTERDTNLWSETYNQPIIYNVHPTGGGGLPIRVHNSRVIRFDGIQALSDSNFNNYEDYWGVSELVPVIISLLEDQSLASAIAHMSQEASIPVLGVSDLRGIMAGTAGKSGGHCG